MRVRDVLLVACGVALVGCSDDPVSPTGVSGSLSFSYTGAGATSATTFSASGTIPSTVGSSNNLGTGAWAAGSISQTSDFTVVGAAIPKTSISWDIAQVAITRKTIGTSDIDPNCDFEADCTSVFMILALQPDGDESTFGCGLTTGTVTITAISSTNITGTFSGTGTCFSSAGLESPFTITNGSFNVGVTTQLLD